MKLRPSLRIPAAAAVSLTILACGGEGDGTAQASPSGGGGSLGAPTHTFPEDFGTIQTVRELDDGRLLVADPLGGALYVVDLEAGTRERIGTEGQGPGEYRQPDSVWPIAGDSTLVVDLGNGRFITVDADFEFGPTTPLSQGNPREGLVIALPQGVDARGNVYAQGMMGGGPGAQLPDSGAIMRIVRGSFEVDTIAKYKLQERTRTVSGGPNNQSVSIQQVPLSPEDAWGVAPDGSVVIARSSDYHVEWHRPDGTVRSGPPVPFDPVPIGRAEQEEWIAAQGQTGGGIGISVSINNGAMQTNFSRGGMRMGGQSDPTPDDYQWPEVKPPFYDTRIVVDPMGRAWVRRHVEAGEDATYDLFDGTGARVTTYTLPNNKRVIGFGDGAVYVVSYDEFDLNWLERYALR